MNYNVRRYVCNYYDYKKIKSIRHVLQDSLQPFSISQ